MASYGYATINDGVMADASAGGGINTSFMVHLGCSQNAISIGGNVYSKAYFSKTLERIASIKNPVKAAKRVVSEYAGCDEASMFRNRVLALARIKLSVSSEQFRFKVPE